MSASLTWMIRPKLISEATNRRSISGVVASFFLLSASAHAYTFTTLYHFTDKADGGEPIGGVVQDAAGTLYGETSIGGGVPCSAKPANQGCGTVYSLSSAGAFKVLATFTGPNGGHGNITPVLVGNTLFGATSGGGTFNDGVVFSVNTDGTNFTVLHAFTGTDGADPVALAAGPSGKIYGVTKTGGADNDGALFSLTPAGSYTLLHSFSLPDSSDPTTLVSTASGLLVGGTFYGGTPSASCPQGCGTVFSYMPSTMAFKTQFVLAASGQQGNGPYVGDIGPGSSVYTASSTEIFGLSRASGYAPLGALDYYTVGGGVQSGPVAAPNGILYGVLGASITATDGLIYSLQNGVVTDLYVFDGYLGAIGKDAIAQPILTSTGSLIGTTHESGLCNPCGTVWEYTP